MAIKNTHRLLVFIISTCAIVSTAYAESGRTDYDLDDDGLIEINSLADLNEIRNNLDGTTLYGESVGCPVEGCNGFELTTTLDFDTNADGVMDENDEYWNNGEGWEPIGGYSATFTAIFDGNGYQIRNLYIQRPNKENVGLFGYVKEQTAALINLGLTGKLMSVTGLSVVGGLVGRLDASSSLMNVFSTGPISGRSNSVGGLVGYSISGTIMNAFSLGAVEGNNYVGGLVGLLSSGSSITNTFTTGTVNGLGSTGSLFGAVSESIINNSFASSVVTVEDMRSYGFVGLLFSGEFFNSHWATDITGQELSDDESELDNYFGATLAALQCPTSSDDTECLVGHTLYANWDSSVWDFGTNQELPGLIIDGVVYRDSDGDGSLDVNQSPEVALLLKQDGDVVTEVIEGEGDVTIEAVITDPDLSDRHTLNWTLSDFTIVGETDNTKATFSSDNLIEGEYTVSVIATDNRFSPLSAEASIAFTIVGGKSSGGGALNLYWLLLLGGILYFTKKYNKRIF